MATNPGTGDQVRIAVLLSCLGGGGVQRSIFTLVDAFVKRGHKVDLVVCHPAGHFEENIPPGVRLIGLKEAPALEGRWSALRADPGGFWRMLLPVLLPRSASRKLRYIPDLARYLRQERATALLTLGTYLTLVALWARRLVGAHTVVVASQRANLSQEHFYGRKKRKWRYRYLLPVLQRTYPWVADFICVSNGVADNLSSLTGIPRERMTTIYNPVLTPDIFDLAKAPLNHPWFYPEEPPVVLGVGRLVDQKDFATLLRAFARVRAQREVRLVILGEGKRRTALEKLAHELEISAYVDLPGFAANPFSYMARAGVFVLSSAYEGLPGALIQAMACGCPVVSTDCPDGPKEILNCEAYGPLVPVGDDRALAKAILTTLETPPEPAVLRARAEEFSVDKAADLYLQVLAGGEHIVPCYRRRENVGIRSI